jgi:hypothetical protein
MTRQNMTPDMVASTRSVRQPGIDTIGAKTHLPPDTNAYEPAAIDLALYRALGYPRLSRDIGKGQQRAAVRPTQ